MRISDWSSVVCSSDLQAAVGGQRRGDGLERLEQGGGRWVQRWPGAERCLDHAEHLGGSLWPDDGRGAAHPAGSRQCSSAAAISSSSALLTSMCRSMITM